MDPASISQVLDQVERGELSAMEGVHALRRPMPVSGQETGREWLPLWLRIVVAEKGESGIRLWLPLFIVLPLTLVVILVLLPFVLIGLFFLRMRGHRVPRKTIGLIPPIFFGLLQLFLNGRGAGVEVEDNGNRIIVQLT